MKYYLQTIYTISFFSLYDIVTVYKISYICSVAMVYCNYVSNMFLFLF